MVQENQPDISYELALKLRDLEESHKLMKERVLLIGQNLINSQEKDNEEIIELKKQVQNLNTEIKKLKSSIESISQEVAKSARKEELAILSRQYKMFEPAKSLTKQEVEDLIDEKLNKQQSPDNGERHNFWRGRT